MNIAESIIHARPWIGAKLDIDRKLRDDELLFGECQSGIIVTLDEDQLYELILFSDTSTTESNTDMVVGSVRCE